LSRLCHQEIHQRTRAGARLADIDPLAFDVGEGFDAGIGASDDRQRFIMERKDCPQIFLGAKLFEISLAIIGVVLNVRLGDTEIEFAATDGVDVVDGGRGRFHRTADAVLASVLVHQAADRAADRIVDAGDAACADRDELLVLSKRSACTQRRGKSGSNAGHVDLGEGHSCLPLVCSAALSMRVCLASELSRS
jgi:hypothetical protein